METAGAEVAYNQYPVYLGSWVNWSRGKVLGATLTMTRENGNLLIAFTALFVAFVSSRFWRIACFLLHRKFSSPDARDALHHQRQVILRNSWGPEESAWTLGQLLFAWRSSNRRALARLWPILACASLCICAFSLAGGFSSQISTAVGDEVLIASSDCGLLLMQTGLTTHDIMVATLKSESALASSAANYAQQCYSKLDNSISSTVFDCNTFATSHLPVTVDNDAPCPFNETICRSKSNIKFDTGYLDSNEHFGINSPPDERFLYRHVYTCAPLVTEGFTQDTIGLQKNFTNYHYGPAIIPGSMEQLTNFTFEVRGTDSQYSADDFTSGKVLISQGNVGVISGYTANRTVSYQSTYDPIPELFRPDADVSLVYFMGNGLLFNSKSTDDWYRATEPFLTHATAGFMDDQPMYRLDEAAAPMACAEQFQFCRASFPEDTRCGPLASRFDALAGAAPLFGVPEEVFVAGGDYDENNPIASMFIWLYYMSFKQNGPTTWLLQPGSSTLLSQQSVFSGMQLDDIPNDQWKRDVSHWLSTYLAILQTSFAEVAAGVHDPELAQHRIIPNPLQQDTFCNNQIIRSRLHTSFSIFGLCFILIVGGLITIVSYILTPLFHSRDRRKHGENRSAGIYRKDLEWTTNDVLHLQSLSYKPMLDHGVGWSKFDEDIPVLQPGNYELRPLMFDEGVVYEDEKRSMPMAGDDGDEKGDRDSDRKVARVQVEKIQGIHLTDTNSSDAISIDKRLDG